MATNIKFGSLRKAFTVEEAALLISGSAHKTIEELRARIALIDTFDIDKWTNCLLTEPHNDQHLESSEEICSALQLEIESSIVWSARGSEDIVDESKTVIRHEALQFHHDEYFNTSEINFSSSLFTRESIGLWCKGIGIDTDIFKPLHEYNVSQNNKLTVEQTENRQQEIDRLLTENTNLKRKLEQLESNKTTIKKNISNDEINLHKNTSEHFKVALEANNKFWENYNEEDITTAPIKDSVTVWLEERNFSKSTAKALDTILRQGRQRAGR
jgi:hypothetical protein